MGSLPNYINNTTMDTPYARAKLAADGIQMPGDSATMSQPWLNAAPQRQDFMIRNPKFDPNDPWSGPEMIPNPSATATPTAFSNSAGTTGVLNPYGLTQNNASAGYYGAPAPPPAAATPPPTTSGGGTPPPGGTANTTTADDNRPPDQRGFEGNYNPTTGMTGYATPKGVFMMDKGGNWFSQDGAPVQFDQSQSGGGGGGGEAEGVLQPYKLDPNSPEYADYQRSRQVPPDQRGEQGNYNADTGMTDYGEYSMDQSGNWFGKDGSPVNFDQSQGQGGGNVTYNTNTLTGGGTTAAANRYTINGKTFEMTPSGQLIEVGAGGGGNTKNGPPAGGGVDPNKDAAAHPGMTLVNGQWMPAQTSPNTPPPPAGGAPGNSPFQTGVTSSSIDPKTGQMRYDPTNPNQFATQDAANSLATRYGGTAYGMQLEGPGMGFSSPMQMVRFGNGNQINAGLATQALGRPEYGSGAPGSYGDYMVSRDVNGTYGGGYDQWARSQPGFRENPRLANTGPGVGNQYQHAAPPPQPQQQPYYPQQQRPTSTAQAGAEQYQQYQAPSQGYQGGGGWAQGVNQQYGPQQGNQQAASYQNPQYDQLYGQQAYQDSMRAQNYYQGQSGQPQYQTSRQSQQNPYYPTQQPQYQQGQQSYYGGSGGNTRQPQQSYYQQPSYTAGTASTYKSPYGGGYVNYSSPTQSKSGGYMQTGKTTF